ncbi:protein containing MEMO/AMMECR1 domain [Sulfurimonas gotlandica GD1]|uniref:Protein containing MEMO/AMMECR1 domain n=1 Tax=Sulfurimonas gotlandica (strain DSM 19862 / JCM 16533 / GD1) TaxID=929558 RepID=B6BLF8_SULGG|nr:AmmeMemoRadiSam system protein B [Sulfurimonas gotlandica]EDZ62046.1 ammecr1 domain protein [Sulfurimonas gotlandica GD1]EHP28613.1 protein containing MEMO/AMMECR1 domain [Sulfurimonas gotlandica GD1]
MRSKFKIVQLFLLLFLLENLHALRPTAVAGSFYTNNKPELQREVNTLLRDAKTFPKQNINALIVPHAGYVFSANVASTAYKTLNKKYKNIFLIGSSHYTSFDGASVYNIGDYKTPLGNVQVNRSIASKLIKDSKYFVFRAEAHEKEHTLEVQLPFLQTIYGDDLKIVPIIIATSNLQTIISISKTLSPYFNDDNLFIISTDLSHYPTFRDANIVDKNILDSLVKNSPKKFVEALAKNEDAKIEALQTSACGWTSLLTLLYMTQDKAYKYETLEYKNSAHSKYGDKKRVVGYGAMRVYKSDEFFLTVKEKQELLKIAKESLYEAIINKKRHVIDESKVSAKLREPLGAFVTLHKENRLRGCIGTFEPDKPLYKVIVDMTIASALNDERFKEVTPDELKNIDIEVSVLTPRKKISSLDEIVIGKHGIYIKKDSKTGTYLPHVATQMKWNVKEFVGNCSNEKVGIGFDGYKDAELFIYEAIVFDKKGL